ncbi:MAG: cytochrome C oxidase subunit IV family protein [Pseudomonadales bacterium]|nr:cytochrome C oxidase subunit IV family protein [Pseudomonadales bacterium]
MNPARRITLIWLLLMLATLLSWQLGHGAAPGTQRGGASIAILLIALVKARFVFLEFMELRGAPWPLRLAFEAWAVLVGVALIALYWSGLTHYASGQ